MRKDYTGHTGGGEYARFFWNFVFICCLSWYTGVDNTLPRQKFVAVSVTFCELQLSSADCKSHRGHRFSDTIQTNLIWQLISDKNAHYLMGTWCSALNSCSISSESTLSFSSSCRNLVSRRNEKWSLYLSTLQHVSIE